MLNQTLDTIQRYHDIIADDQLTIGIKNNEIVPVKRSYWNTAKAKTLPMGLQKIILNPLKIAKFVENNWQVIESHDKIQTIQNIWNIFQHANYHSQNFQQFYEFTTFLRHQNVSEELIVQFCKDYRCYSDSIYSTEFAPFYRAVPQLLDIGLTFHEILECCKNKNYSSLNSLIIIAKRKNASHEICRIFRLIFEESLSIQRSLMALTYEKYRTNTEENLPIRLAFLKQIINENPMDSNFTLFKLICGFYLYKEDELAKECYEFFKQKFTQNELEQICSVACQDAKSMCFLANTITKPGLYSIFWVNKGENSGSVLPIYFQIKQKFSPTQQLYEYLVKNNDLELTQLIEGLTHYISVDKILSFIQLTNRAKVNLKLFFEDIHSLLDPISFVSNYTTCSTLLKQNNSRGKEFIDLLLNLSNEIFDHSAPVQINKQAAIKILQYVCNSSFNSFNSSRISFITHFPNQANLHSTWIQCIQYCDEVESLKDYMTNWNKLLTQGISQDELMQVIHQLLPLKNPNDIFILITKLNITFDIKTLIEDVQDTAQCEIDLPILLTFAKIDTKNRKNIVRLLCDVCQLPLEQSIVVLYSYQKVNSYTINNIDTFIKFLPLFYGFMNKPENERLEDLRAIATILDYFKSLEQIWKRNNEAEEIIHEKLIAITKLLEKLARFRRIEKSGFTQSLLISANDRHGFPTCQFIYFLRYVQVSKLSLEEIQSLASGQALKDFIEKLSEQYDVPAINPLKNARKK